MNALRDTIREQVHRMVGAGQIDLARPVGDDGLFGPASASWAVHGDMGAMVIGGVSALLIQMLHPAALAGIWDHSRFRDDMAGRLRRTAQFIGGTTYGSTAIAEGMIDRVRRIHDGVSGTLPDGTRYHANDPALLTWVHVAETTSFLAAHLRYRDPGFPAARQDLYHAEMAGLARRLGAGAVPDSRRAAAAYLAEMRPALVVDARTRDVAQALLGQPAATPLHAILLQAGVDLLPGWAAARHGLHVPGRLAVRAGAMGSARMLRWALKA